MRSPENSFDQRGEGTKQPVDLAEVHIAATRQPVILVADDDALIRNLVALMLQQEGYVILSAADGHEGLDLSRRYPGAIDLVITDMVMPRMNGSDLCAHLLGERPGIKVLVMSGADTSEIVSQNANLPFLPKPFDGQSLKSRVRALLAAEMPNPPDRPQSPAVQPARAAGTAKAEREGNAAGRAMGA